MDLSLLAVGVHAELVLSRERERERERGKQTTFILTVDVYYSFVLKRLFTEHINPLFGQNAKFIANRYTSLPFIWFPRAIAELNTTTFSSPTSTKLIPNPTA